MELYRAKITVFHGLELGKKIENISSTYEYRLFSEDGDGGAISSARILLERIVSGEGFERRFNPRADGTINARLDALFAERGGKNLSCSDSAVTSNYGERIEIELRLISEWQRSMNYFYPLHL